MESLPNEIVERILRFDDISFPDLVAFSSTCSRFKVLAANNDLWRCKLCQRFKSLYGKIMAQVRGRGLNSSSVDWCEELKRRMLTGREVESEVAAMSPRLFHDTELSISDFTWFDDLLMRHNPNRSLLHLHTIDALLAILEGGAREDKLTWKYYANKALAHVQHRLLKGSLEQMWEGMEESLKWEEGLVLVAQWCQPCKDIQAEEVGAKLNRLAERVLEHLVSSHPDLAIFDRIREQQKEQASIDLTKLPCLGELKDSAWPPGECKLLLDATNQIFYQQEEFSGNSDDYYNPNNSYINMVLENKKGIPITLCLLYSCLLKRLGVILTPVNFPGHFLLRWNAHPDESGQMRFAYIDAFEGGRQMTYQGVRERMPHMVSGDEDMTASPGECVRRMLRNLISIGASRSNNMRDGSYSLLRCALELMMEVNTTDTMQYAFMLSRIYLQLNINQHEVRALLADQLNPGLADQVEYLMHQCQLQLDEKQRERSPTEPKKRGVAASFPYGEVSFYVGQVCRHAKYHYTCVIHGWDPQCTASASWISHMGVDKLPLKDKQPFYNVLVADGSQRYAAQENLVPLDRPCPVPHPEVGRYFTCLHPSVGYIPNHELALEYPDENQLSGGPVNSF